MNPQQMNPSQYYGSPANVMPVPTAAPYYQPPMMSPRPAIMSPRPADPPVSHTNHVPQFIPPVINQPNPMQQYSPPPYQYGNNQNMNYSGVNPGVRNSPSYQPSQQNPPLNQVNFTQSQMPQNYQHGQPDQMSFYQGQNLPAQTYTNFNNDANQYVNVQGSYNAPQPMQNAYSSSSTKAGNFYPQQVDPQQMQYPATPNTSNIPTTQIGEPGPISNREPPQSKEPTQKEENKFQPTNVIGEYKCSDFPNLFTGPFRYSGYPVQRKPFTMRSDPSRRHSQTNPERRTHIGLARHAKRWELRGGKYYGCFTSRTNGLQDVCPKAKCKLCPTDKRK